jgi:hypothetical protein
MSGNSHSNSKLNFFREYSDSDWLERMAENVHVHASKTKEQL